MAWLFPVLVLLLSGGFAKLAIATLNCWFARRLPKWVLMVSHLVNVSLIAGYVVLLTRGPGSSWMRAWARGDLLSESLANGPWPTLVAVLLPGLVGLGLLAWSVVEFQLATTPACQLGYETTHVNLRLLCGETSWKSSLVGLGPMRRMAPLPGNEQFTLVISTKTYAMSRLPAEWNGLSLVQLSDLHFRGAVSRRYFELVCEQALTLQPDLFVFSGDLLDDPSLIAWLPETLGRLQAPLGCYFVLGNHDWYLDPSAIRTELTRLGWIDIAGRTVSLRELPRARRVNEFSPASSPPAAASPIILCGDETPWMGTHPDLSGLPDETFRILVSHTPDNILWARRRQIDLMLTGHTHGGQIRLPFLGPIYSPSQFGCRYSAGEFQLEPTLLHVSRGISGREPIRYGCPPELAKLVLRSV